MKYMFSLAVKNLLRRKRRAILTFSIISFGITIYIIMACFLEGFDRHSFRNLIESETGHMKIRSSQYSEERPYSFDHLIEGTDSMLRQIEGYSYIEKAAPRLLFMGEADNSIDSAPVAAVAMDREKDSRVFSVEKYCISGGLEKGGALMGKVLAGDLGLTQGDSFYLTFRGEKGMISSMMLAITGILKTSNPKINSSTVFLNLDEAQKYLDTDKVSEYAVRTENIGKVNEYRDRLSRELGPQYSVVTWEALAEDFAAITRTKRKARSMFFVFIMIIAVAGIVNTMIMSVYEKKREIGTLKSLGMKDREVSGIFLIEGFIIGFLGSLGGVFLAALINLYPAVYGIDWMSMVSAKGNDFGLNVSGSIKSAWDISSFIISVVLSIAVSVLASYFPARKVMKMQPHECLRTVQ